jgi:hypothetical protein
MASLTSKWSIVSMHNKWLANIKEFSGFICIVFKLQKTSHQEMPVGKPPTACDKPYACDVCGRTRHYQRP